MDEVKTGVGTMKVEEIFDGSIEKLEPDAKLKLVN